MQSSLGVQTFRTSKGTHTNVLAILELDILRNLLKSFMGILISRVNDPSIGLHEHGGAQISIGVPPVTRATSRTTGAQHTFVKSIQKFSVLLRLIILSVMLTFFFLSLEERFN